MVTPFDMQDPKSCDATDTFVLNIEMNFKNGEHCQIFWTSIEISYLKLPKIDICDIFWLDSQSKNTWVKAAYLIRNNVSTNALSWKAHNMLSRKFSNNINSFVSPHNIDTRI